MPIEVGQSAAMAPTIIRAEQFHGFWLLLENEVMAVPFAEFPWLEKATIEQLVDVERPTENHLYWPQLDVDLSVESIRTPAAFPLVSRAAG